MRHWRRAGLILLVGSLAATLAWAQQSSESSRPVRGTGTPGVPSDGALTIQGVLQGRPVTVDFHHNAAALAVTSHSVGVSHITSVVHVTTGQSPHVTSFWVNCGTTAAIAVTPKVDTIGRRRDLFLQNAGTVNVHVGGTHVTVTTTNAVTLHASSASPFTSRLVLENYQGRIDCIADGPSQTLQIMEIWR